MCVYVFVCNLMNICPFAPFFPDHPSTSLRTHTLSLYKYNFYRLYKLLYRCLIMWSRETKLYAVVYIIHSCRVGSNINYHWIGSSSICGELATLSGFTVCRYTTSNADGWRFGCICITKWYQALHHGKCFFCVRFFLSLASEHFFFF